MVDFSYIQDIAGGDDAVFKSLLMLISKNLNEYPQQIQRLYEKQEMQAMRELVHKYKSSTAYLHFTPLNEILNKLEHPLEHSLKESDYAPLLEKVASFSAYIESAIQEKLGQ